MDQTFKGLVLQGAGVNQPSFATDSMEQRVRSADVFIRPAANLLELFHARQLRDAIALQVVRLEEQSCLVGWGTSMAEFEPLYCDSTIGSMRDPLNADEVRSHYRDLMVAMDHLLEQLGEFPVER